MEREGDGDGRIIFQDRNKCAKYLKAEYLFL